MQIKNFWIAISLTFPTLAFAQTNNGSAGFRGTWEEYTKIPGGNFIRGDKEVPYVYEKGKVPELRGRTYYSDYFKEGNPELKNIKIIVRNRWLRDVTQDGFIYIQSVRPGTKVEGKIDVYIDILELKK